MTTILSPFAEQFALYWKTLTRIQKLIVLAAAVVGLVLIAAFVVWAASPEYAIAYSGLSDADAGAVVEQLKAQNIDYQLQGSGTVLVPRDEVYDTRLNVATEGLLTESGIGFELFDTASVFGMTEFSQGINLQRALEGELARTIESLDPVATARVHIVMPEDALFAEQQNKTTAAITVKLEARQTLKPAQVQSVMNLTASSVQGLEAEEIVIIDSVGNMLAGQAMNKDKVGAALNQEQYAAQRALETEIETKVQDMLAQALGPNRSIVRANAYMIWDEVEIVEQNFFPDSIVRSEQVTTESYTGSADKMGGLPGAASNLPGDQGIPTYQQVAETGTNIDYAHTETTTNYEVGGVEERRIPAPGQLQTVSLSVLVDNVTDEETMAALTAIAARAAGINEEEGDMITVESIPFDQQYFEKQEAQFEEQQRSTIFRQLSQWTAIALVAIGALWFTQRLLRNLRLRAEEQDVWNSLMLPDTPDAAQPDPALASGTASGQPSVPLSATRLAGVEELPPTFEEEDQLPEMPDLERTRQAVQRIAEQRPMTVAEIIRMWIEQEEMG